MTIDYAQRLVTVTGQPVSLTVLEYRLLVELSTHAGRALSHERLVGARSGDRPKPRTQAPSATSSNV
ncbi:MAG: hypothetical protein OXH38_11930 [Chloroflexi bacterium]|nr:hypothetical protein [Chloroflexota bacterium]